MWVDIQGKIYFGDCATGDREATADEIAAWEESRKPTVRDQLKALDASNTLTQRNQRESIMLMNEAFKTISGGALDLSHIPGVAQVYAVEAQAEVLRAML